MKEQDSILLQKKMILFLSTIIITLLLALTYKANLKTKKIAVAVETYNNNLITVKRPEEYEYVLSEQVAYTASREVFEESNDNEIEEDKIEDTEASLIAETNDEQKENEIVKEEIKEVANEVKTVSYKELAENSPPTEYKEVIEATATAYCLCQKCCGKSPSSPGYGVTASGLKIVPGTGMKVIAVDPKVIPLGSKVYVEGLNGAWDYGYAVAGDTGGAIKSMKIDLYMDSHDETLSWGRKKVNIYVID